MAEMVNMVAEGISATDSVRKISATVSGIPIFKAPRTKFKLGLLCILASVDMMCQNAEELSKEEMSVLINKCWTTYTELTRLRAKKFPATLHPAHPFMVHENFEGCHALRAEVKTTSEAARRRSLREPKTGDDLAIGILSDIRARMEKMEGVDIQKMLEVLHLICAESHSGDESPLDSAPDLNAESASARNSEGRS
ncbi:hypothetical protein C8R44DRAFT_974775 [Mycena epipterygia]|nr:hypothetical protein C8R44DRAFT_974775 [Mycena epipterygia]